MEQELIKSLYWRYAVKKFDPTKKIEPYLIDKIADAIRLSPSSFGLQAWNLVIISNQNLKKSLFDYAIPQKQALDCSHLFVFQQKKVIDDEYIEAFTAAKAKTQNLSIEATNRITNFLKKQLINKDPQQLKIWLSNQVYIALGVLICAASLYGIDNCPMEGFSKENLDEHLGIKNNLFTSTVICALGYRLPTDTEGNIAKFRRCQKELITKL